MRARGWAMFERFTDRSRRVVVLAQEEARLLDHDYIGTEHMLLGLLHEGDGVAASALVACGMDLMAARAEVLRIVGRGASAPRGHIPFTPMAKATLERALREALSLGHNYIGTEHVLLGLLVASGPVDRDVFEALDVSPTHVRAKVLELVGADPHGSAAAIAGAREVQIMASPSSTGEVLDQVVQAVQLLTGRPPDVVPRPVPSAGTDAAASRFRRKGVRADVVVFVLSGDDVGTERTAAEPPDPASLRPRPSQDTIYHLGWLHGLLGRKRVIALVEEGVERPAGIDVRFTVLDAAGTWRPALDTALQEAGIAAEPGESA